MFEVLVYLFENYFEAEIRPDHDTLTHELTAAGFTETDIQNAFGWFGTFDDLARHPVAESPIPDESLRIYTAAEISKLGSESVGVLMLQEQCGTFSPEQRELIIDRAMALPDHAVKPEQLRWIIFMTLQIQHKPVGNMSDNDLFQGANTNLH